MTYLRSNDIDTVYLVGNNYHGNILDTYIGLTEGKYKVVLVTDAIVNPTDYVMDKFKSFAEQFDNLRFVTTKEALAELAE